MVAGDRKTLFLAIGMAVLATGVVAMTGGDEPMSEARRVAQEYIEAYGAFDLDRVQELYAEDAVFTDPTSFSFVDFGAPYHWEGRSTIMAELRKLASEQGVQAVRYFPSQVFEASGRVVFVADLRPVYKVPEGLIRTEIPIVTIVTVEDGRVVEHRDYADYARLRTVGAEEL